MPGKYERVFVVVCDSMGFGAARDAADYGDADPDTIGHVAEANGGLHIPNMELVGAGVLRPILGVGQGAPHGTVALLQERSRGKDTITGHWEMMGVVTEDPFVTFTDTGFPQDLIVELERRTGRHVIGNKAASGTEILDELAEFEIADPKNMIVYTSADSVLQICGCEDVAGGLDELYRCCRIAREITLSRPEWRVGRVIARPYSAVAGGGFARTANRRDYSVAPPCPTMLDAVKGAGKSVIAVGKIEDIFAGQGITESAHSQSSEHGMEQAAAYLEDPSWSGLCFVNLADFDVLWGHRRNPSGYAGEIEAFDRRLGTFMEKMGNRDLLVVTADHGNDPTAPGTDHTREDVPLLMWSPAMRFGTVLGDLPGFYYVGAVVSEALGIELPDCFDGLDIMSGMLD